MRDVPRSVPLRGWAVPAAAMDYGNGHADRRNNGLARDDVPQRIAVFSSAWPPAEAGRERWHGWRSATWFAVHQAGVLMGPRPFGSSTDPLVRRKRFETAHPEVTILPPATLNSRWLAVVPPGSVPDEPMRTTLSGWQLEELLAQLEQLWPPQGWD